MDEVFGAIEAGDYLRAYDALQRTHEARTQVGAGVGGLLLALGGRFDDADHLCAHGNVPAIAVISRGERQRLARWTDPRVAGSLAASVPLPFVGMYAGMALALLQRDEALITRIKQDMQSIRPVPGRVTINGQARPFNDFVDADDAIGQMLETYCGEGLMYFPFATLSRIDFLPKTNFMDLLMPKVQITDKQGNSSGAFVPLLYAQSSTHPDQTIRTGRMTTFDYIGQARGRRPRGQRDFFADGGTMIGLQNISSIEFA